MNLKRTRLNILHTAEKLDKKADTGVSLHCHTENSKEMLDFVPHYAAKLPVINFFWERERVRYETREQRKIDFSNAFWSPPMKAHEVFEIEKKQMNDAGLDALVSLSDHDSIDGNLKLNETADNAKAPISLEWTVPFEFGFFHVGVHNLPQDRAVAITKDLISYSFGENPTDEKLHDKFAMLTAMPEVLVVLNHPLWDIEIVGKQKHLILLKGFLKEHGKWLHALEINGFRSWSENKAVIELAETHNFPVVTGGDRHGCKPNTVINLTNAKTFAEFAEEVRVDKHTEVVLMPEYKQPLHSRQLQSFAEILKLYPEFPEGRRRWFDRVHFDTGDGGCVRPLSAYGWADGGPLWLRIAVKTLGFFGSPAMRPFFALARKKQDRVPKNVEKTDFQIPNSDDISPSLTSDSVSQHYL